MEKTLFHFGRIFCNCCILSCILLRNTYQHPHRRQYPQDALLLLTCTPVPTVSLWRAQGVWSYRGQTILHTWLLVPSCSHTWRGESWSFCSTNMLFFETHARAGVTTIPCTSMLLVQLKADGPITIKLQVGVFCMHLRKGLILGIVKFIYINIAWKTDWPEKHWSITCTKPCYPEKVMCAMTASLLSEFGLH